MWNLKPSFGDIIISRVDDDYSFSLREEFRDYLQDLAYSIYTTYYGGVNYYKLFCVLVKKSNKKLCDMNSLKKVLLDNTNNLQEKYFAEHTESVLARYSTSNCLDRLKRAENNKWYKFGKLKRKDKIKFIIKKLFKF